MSNTENGAAPAAPIVPAAPAAGATAAPAAAPRTRRAPAAAPAAAGKVTAAVLATFPRDTAALKAGEYGAIHSSKSLVVASLDGKTTIPVNDVAAVIAGGRFILRGVTYKGEPLSAAVDSADDYAALATLMVRTLRLRSLKPENSGWVTPAGFVSLLFPTAVLPYLPAALAVPVKPAPSNPRYNVKAATRLGTGGSQGGATNLG